VTSEEALASVGRTVRAWGCSHKAFWGRVEAVDPRGKHVLVDHMGFPKKRWYAVGNVFLITQPTRPVEANRSDTP
jgi:hypothetical protein